MATSTGSRFSPRGLTRSSAQHPKRVLAIWAAVFMLAMVLAATTLEGVLTTEFAFAGEPDAEKADALLEEKLRGPRPLNEIILVSSAELTVDDSAFQAKVEEVIASVGALGPEITSGGFSYYMTRDESMVSADRHTTFTVFAMQGEFKETVENAEQVLAVVEEADGADGFRVLVIGESSSAFEGNEVTTTDLNNGERFGIPAAGLILLVLFGAAVAALLPLLLALVAIVVAVGATAIVGQLFDLIFFIVIMIVMIGLAVGIDYSLIVVSRFREELAKDGDRIEALTRTGATASRTVLFSGITVVIALAGMLVVPANIFRALGLGAILVVVAAVVATLTLLPAVLSLLGHRVNWLRLPLVGRRTARPADDSRGGFWNMVTNLVMRYPAVSLLVAGGLMLASASPVLDMKTGFNGIATFPDGMQTKEAFLLLDKEFSFGVATPTEIVVIGDVGSAPVQEAVERLQAMMSTDPDFVGVATLQANAAGDLLLVSQPIAGEPAGLQATEAVVRLREHYIPDSFAGVDADVFVGGLTAFNQDFFDIVDRFTPIVFALVLTLSFLLLMVVFRSIVIPIKSIILNLLSVGAAYGLMVLVFQQGFMSGILPFRQSPIIDAWIPLFLFTVLFGLSMDYHVFLLSRVRERFDQTGDNAGSVAYGLRATAGLITGAALIMVAVFSGFAAGQVTSNQQVGFGLAVAIFLDATIVRSVMVPASMRLLGRANWWFPSALHWVPRLGIEPPQETEPAVAG